MYVCKVFEVEPPRSPDLNPLYFVCGDTYNRPVYPAPTENGDTLHQRIFDVCQTTRNRPETSETVRQSVIRRAHACVDSGGAHLQHLL